VVSLTRFDLYDGTHGYHSVQIVTQY